MKKLITIGLAMVSTMLTATTITSVQDGKFKNNSSYDGALRYNADTIIIKHALTWDGDTKINKNGHDVKFIRIDSGGSLSATGTNAKLRFKTGVQILVRLGGKISNASGNNSKHAIIIHCYCVWGKQCCGSNDDILGDRLVSESNPCGWVALQHRSDSVNVFAEMQDGLKKIGSTLSVNMPEFSNDLNIKIFDFSGRLIFRKETSPISSVDISEISASGFYILTLEAEGMMIVNRKIYIQTL